MAEETTNANTEVASSTVTDADLEGAAQEAVGASEEEQQPTEKQTEEVVEEQPVEEEQPVPSQTDKEIETLKTRLRKYESNIGTLMATVNEIKQHVTAPKTEPEFEIPTNWDEQRNVVQRIIQEEKQKDVQAAKQYETDYLGTVTELTPSDMPKEDIDGIQAELFTNFNVRRSDNGRLDAATNFAYASRAYYSKKSAGRLKEAPGRSKKVEEPLGGATTQKASSAKQGPEVELDEYAREFVKSTGMDEEEAKKVLKKPMPAYLGG